MNQGIQGPREAEKGRDTDSTLEPPKGMQPCRRPGFSPLVNSDSCAGHTVRPNRPKPRSLEQRKVYCKAMQGNEVAYALKCLEVPEGFWQSIFKSQVKGRGIAGYVIRSCTIL